MCFVYYIRARQRVYHIKTLNVALSVIRFCGAATLFRCVYINNCLVVV